MNNTLSNGLQILELLAHEEGGMGVRTIARRLGLGTSTTHRLLTTLTETGFVAQYRESKKYGLTLKVWSLGSQFVAKWDIKEIGAPHLRELADQINETVHLSVLHEMEVLYIDKIDSRHPVRAYSQVGGRAPAYCVATGKTLLAFTTSAQQALPQLELKPYTVKTITDHGALIDELRKIRSLGYAINAGEWRDSVRGLAAPVYNSRNEVVCAVGISGPADRLTMQRLQKYAQVVMRVASAMSADMGMLMAPDFHAERG